MGKAILIGLFAIVVLIGGVLILSCDPITKKCFGARVLGDAVLSEHLSPSDYKRELESGKYKLIDVRKEDEYKAGHIKNANQKDYYKTEEFSEYLDSLDKNGKYLIYCRSGKRSSMALELMKQKGFKNVSDLAGGLKAWEAEKYPIEK